MEVIKWVDIFGGDVIGYIGSFCGLIIMFRIISFIFPAFKQADAMIYFSKIIMHSILVIMILLYYVRTQSGINSIDVLTGFTLLFSMVEIADCLLMFIKEWFNKKVYESFNAIDSQLDSKREEKEFFEIVSRLRDIEIMLHPGKVDSDMSRKIEEVYQIYKGTSLYTVNLIVAHGAGEGDNFDSHMMPLFNNKSIRQIIAYEYGNIEQPIFLNYIKCEELIEIIDKAINCKYIYIKELEKFKEDKKMEQYVESLEKVNRFESKYYGIGEVVVDKIINYKRKFL